ncbi:MAG TPA: hypothetical protein VLK79_16625 [Gaiellales bacterium]|nr:hypothetical protein [Gaiellales bacterium]
MGDQPWRTGAGAMYRKHPGPPPEVVAERLAKMHARGSETRAERAAAHRTWLESVGGMSMEALRHSTPTRFWTVAMMHCGGADLGTIARALGYANVAGAQRALKHPAVQRMVQLVREAQLERVLRGEYGVTAQAQAAAPAVMEHVTELAGARKDKATGERLGRARRDADALRAAELTLTVSGHKVERQAHLHLHVLEEMSEAELEGLATSGTWPERYRNVTGLVSGPEGE